MVAAYFVTHAPHASSAGEGCIHETQVARKKIVCAAGSGGGALAHSPVRLGALHDPSHELYPVHPRERVLQAALAGEERGQSRVDVVLPVDELVRSVAEEDARRQRVWRDAVVEARRVDRCGLGRWGVVWRGAVWRSVAERGAVPERSSRLIRHVYSGKTNGESHPYTRT